MTERWHVPSVQGTGQAVNTVITADVDTGKVLMGHADRGLTHLQPAEARKLADALREAAQRVEPDEHEDAGVDLLHALQRYISES